MFTPKEIDYVMVNILCYVELIAVHTHEQSADRKLHIRLTTIDFLYNITLNFMR